MDVLIAIYVLDIGAKAITIDQVMDQMTMFEDLDKSKVYKERK